MDVRVAQCIVACVAASTLAVHAVPSRAEEIGDGFLRIESAMDATQYLVGQPILVLVKVRNIGKSAFRDLVSLNPASGRLALALERQGFPLPWRGPRLLTAYAQEGMRLLPDEAVCEVIDVVRWFGEEESVPLPDGAKVRMQALPAGHYSLRISLQGARTGRVKTLPQVRVEDVPLEFDIVHDAIDVPSAAFQRRRGDMRATLTTPEKIVLLEQNADSRAISLMWRRLGLQETDYSTTRVENLLVKHRRSPVLIAAIVDDRCQVSTLPDPARLEWVRGAKAGATVPEVASVLDSWRLKLEQREYYIAH